MATKTCDNNCQVRRYIGACYPIVNGCGGTNKFFLSHINIHPLPLKYGSHEHYSYFGTLTVLVTQLYVTLHRYTLIAPMAVPKAKRCIAISY